MLSSLDRTTIARSARVAHCATLLQRSGLFLFFYTFVHVVRVTYISVIAIPPGRGAAAAVRVYWNTGLLLPHPSCFGRT